MILPVLAFALIPMQAGVAPPPPPPAPIEAVPPPIETPPPEAPATTTPLPPPEAKPKPKAPPYGMDPFLVGGIQWATGCGVAVLSLPCNYCSLGLWGCTVEPALIGYTEAYVGDSLGQNRDAAIWPILAAYGQGIAAVAVYIGVLFASGGVAQLTAPAGNTATSAATFAVLGAGIGTELVLSAAVPIVYALTDEPKKAGDTGQGFPGFMAPAHPDLPKTTSVAPVSSASHVMSY